MSKYNLPAHLHALADSAEFIIRNRYKLKNVNVEKEISPSLGWTPTFHWKTPMGYIACEVSERPYPKVLTQVYAEITASGLPIRIISAFPIENSLSAKDCQADKNKAKNFGIGILPTDDHKNGDLEYRGISIPLHMPEPNVKNIHKLLHSPIRHAFEIYMTMDPKHGVQELGQIIERILIDVAEQAKANGTLKTGKFVSAKSFYAQNALIDDFINDKILDKRILKKCGTYADDRNSVSHKPKNLAEAITQEVRIRELFKTGVYILEDLPKSIRDSSLKFNYYG